jgi:hypothetical protein
MLTLTALSWFAGLVCVVCIHSLVRRISSRMWIANVVSLAFVFTQTVLNWAQAGSAYVPGLALLLVGFHILITRRSGLVRQRLVSVLAGAALGGAVCLWVPYLLAVPAAVFAPLCLYGFTRDRFRFALHASIAFAIFTGAAYLAVVAGLGFHTVNEVKAWIASSGHGIDYFGAKRMVFGFARSFINMGNDGLLFKRYLLADPFNPVSLTELFGAALWKLGLFYLFFASFVFTLFRSPASKRILILFLVNAVPVLGLAFFFASSEPERYLPLYPMLFIAISSCLSGPSRIFKTSAFVICAVMVAANLAAMARPALHHKQQAALSRIRDLLPRLDDRAIVFAVTYQDDLVVFNRTYPFDPINRSGRLHLSALVSPGTSWNLHWREDFAARALTTWRAGGATWLSKRAFSQRPRAEWNWAEGDDRRVSWKDFPLLCNQFDIGEDVGGPDGFVRIVSSPKNEQFLTRLAAKAKP